MVGPPRGECAPMTSSTVDVIAAVLFGVAVLHTFLASSSSGLLIGSPDTPASFICLVKWKSCLAFGPSCSWSQSLSRSEAIWRSRTQNRATHRTTVRVRGHGGLGFTPVLQTVVRLVSALARALPVPTQLATASLGLAVVPLLGRS